MRALLLCSVVVLLSLSLLAVYACSEYDRASGEAVPGRMVQPGVIVHVGPARGVPVEPGTNLAEALAACEADAPVCLLGAEHGDLYLCILSRPSRAVAGEWRTVEGQFRRWHLAEGSPPVHVLTGCRLD